MRSLALAGFALTVTVSSVAFAQSAAVVPSPAANPRSTVASSSGPPNPHHATPARLAIIRGGTAYIAHNYDEALAAFREAAGAQPERAEATLDIGYTLAARNDRDGALTAYREALQAAVSASDDFNRARALEAIAFGFENMQRWNDAVAAWQEYITFAEAHSAVASAAIGRGRIDAAHARDQLEQRMTPVRQRIEERRRVNARGNSGSPAP